jgi:type IV pilus assembly protein PilV
VKTQSLKLKTGSTKQRGSVILESLIAMLIFSMGILAIVGLQGASIRNVTGAKYRTDASLLANQVIGQMWTSDKATAALQNNYSSPNGVMYLAWASSVQQALPGVIAGTLPSIVIDGNNQVLITIQWQSPGENAPHQHVAIARING